MKTFLRYTIGLMLTFCSVASLGLNASETVGVHSIRIAEPGDRAQIVSVPFLKKAIARGRIDSVDAELSVLVDANHQFDKLTSNQSYVFRITDGPAVGAWFVIDQSSVSGNRILIDDDGLAGNLNDLNGMEAYAIHELYTLKELFPEDGSVCPASMIDALATTIQFYDGESFSTIWLSNGQITDHTGWTYASGDDLSYAGDIAILPGTSFIISIPNPTEVIDIPILGVALNEPMNIPIYPGYNFIAAKYSTRLTERGIHDFNLNLLGLQTSGFGEEASAESENRVYLFDTQTGQFSSEFYLDASDQTFKEVDTQMVSSGIDTITAGNGFIIYNSGDSYLWSFGQ